VSPDERTGQTRHLEHGIAAVRTETRTARILIIEDEADFAVGIRSTLEATGCAVEWVRDGALGFERAASERFDLLIVDLLLPELNGFLVVSRLRAADVWTPVLVLTAKSGEWDEAESLDGGADDYLTKPVSTTVLLAHVRALLRRSRHIGLRTLSCGELSLDVVRHQCRVGSAQVDLSARETEVLAQFMLRQGEVVTKAELIQAVWGQDFPGNPNVVEVYVRHLRRKLDTHETGSVIETVWGAGYRLSAAMR
jgi:two-component system, OmpR family, response regulator